MKRYYYDLHIHSCLSPCADNDNTPNNIAGMASLSGLNLVALTDHNTCKNCPAFFKAAEKYGIVPIAGMELTTSEDIHVVCLFETLSEALKFDDKLQEYRVFIKNRPDIFGEQPIVDGEDEVIGYEENLLPNATSLSVEDVPELVKSFGGICYPAHIDRESYSILSSLGDFPPELKVGAYELTPRADGDFYSENYKSIIGKRSVRSSDAHYLTDMREKEFYFDLEENSAIALIDYLKNNSKKEVF
jgi:PHP family Zn ribbon phosphoesterase